MQGKGGHGVIQESQEKPHGGGGIWARPESGEAGAVWKSGEECSRQRREQQVLRPWGGSKPGVLKAQ